ncbi:MAG TPA: cysteine rich repeat-containing protein [Methylocella sp.]|nr:cysteine rich repeat-containing protein [Methylocella sp.]
MKSAFSLLIIASLSMAGPALCQTDVRAQQQQACEDDAYRLCPDEIPDEGRVTNCLARQKARLSPACRVWFTQPSRHH